MILYTKKLFVSDIQSKRMEESRPGDSVNEDGEDTQIASATLRAIAALYAAKSAFDISS